MEISMTKRIIKNRLERMCVICGKDFKVILYIDRTYRGGKYWPFGKKKPKDPKDEYWECSKCFYRNK